MSDNFTSTATIKAETEPEDLPSPPTSETLEPQAPAGAPQTDEEAVVEEAGE